MKQLCVTIYVTPAAAVRAGKTQVGDITMTLSDEDVAALSPEQRDALARHVEHEYGWSLALHADAPPVGEASLDSLRVLLDARIARQAREAEAKARSLAEDEQKAKEVIETWKNKPIEEFLDWYGYAKKARLFGYPPSMPWAERSLVDLLGREDDLAALLEARKVERAERERKEAEDRAERDRQDEADYAARKAFVVRHLANGDEDLIAAWYDQIDDELPALRRSLKVALKKGAHEPLALEKDARVGSVHSNCESLALYRAMLELADGLRATLESEPAPIAIEVESVTLFRPAGPSDDPDEVDDDGEVALGDLLRATFTVAGSPVKLYFRA